MSETSGMESPKTSILGEEDSVISQSISSLLLVARLQQAGGRRGSYIDTTSPQALSNRPIAILIQVKSDRPSHCLPSLEDPLQP